MLDAQRTLADAESSLAASDAQVAFAQVDLFKALGGGWQQDQRPSLSVASQPGLTMPLPISGFGEKPERVAVPAASAQQARVSELAS